MTPDELIRVIEACGRLGVNRLKLGPDTEILFTATPQITARPNSPELTRAQEKLDKANLEKDEMRFRDDEVANLLIEDPARYEQLIAQGDLIDETRGA